MKAQLYKILFIALGLFMSVSCVRHNGNIGPLFGMWHVSSITIDDVVDENYDGCMYFAFQSSVFSVTIVDEELHESSITYASWKYDGKDLIIDFSDKEFGPFKTTGMSRGQNKVVVEYQKGDDMTLSYVTSDERKYVYHLKKWGY